MKASRVFVTLDDAVYSKLKEAVSVEKKNGRKMNNSRYIREILANHFGIQELFVGASCSDCNDEETSLRDIEMVRLRNEEMMTLQEIGNIYGVSRERVRQIVGNSGYVNMASVRRRSIIRSSLNKTNSNLAEELGVCVSNVAKHRSDLRHAVEPGNHALAHGSRCEDYIADLLREKGYYVEQMPLSHHFDMLVNGHRVDVKYCRTPKRSPSMRTTSPTQRFGVKGDRGNCDFYVLVTNKLEVFVVPSSKIPDTMDQILFCWPTKRPEIGKYQKYFNRFDLLVANNHLRG